MAAFRITCITPDGVDEDWRIDAFGGSRADGSRWYDSVDNVVAAHDGGHRFWVMVAGRPVDAHPATHPRTFRRYMTTTPDGFRLNNLSALPRCA